MSEHSYSVNLQVTQKTIYSFNDSFELNDAKKWALLRAEAAKILKKTALARFPEDPPEDLKLWFDLYRFLPQDHYDSQDEDLGSDSPDLIYLTLIEDDEVIDTFSSE